MANWKLARQGLLQQRSWLARRLCFREKLKIDSHKTSLLGVECIEGPFAFVPEAIMDLTTLFYNLREEVSCSVCSDLFTDPKHLSCLYRFTGFRTGHRKPGKSWNLSISFSRPGKAWNLIVGPWESWKIKVLFDRLVTADDKTGTI